MAEAATIRIDDKGRILLPAWARKIFKARKVIVHRRKEKQIVLEPVESVDEMFGSFKGLDVRGFRKEHAKER